MPVIQLTTNVKIESEEAAKAFVTDFSKFCAQTIGKEEKWFNVKFDYNPHLTFAGTFDPATMLLVMSLDNVNPVNTRKWSKAFAEYFTEKLGVPSDRGYSSYFDPGAACVGFMGTTIEALQEASKL